jgi:hypothetical protein
MAEYPGPLKPELFPKGKLGTAFGSTGSSGPSRGGVQPCPLTKWGIKELTVTCAGKSSTSYDKLSHPEIAGGRGGRFYFAPGEEEVTIAWKVENPKVVSTLSIYITKAGSPAPVKTWVLGLDEVRKESLVWDGTLKGGLTACVGESPYRVHAVAGVNHADDYKERWTYFDVLVDKVELVWGGKALIPGGAPAGSIAPFDTDTIASEKALNDALALQVDGGGKLDPTHRYELGLDCNQFTTHLYDTEDPKSERKTSLSLHHKNKWGNGARIPLLAKVYVAKAAGGSVFGGASVPSLRGAKFLWDWYSEDELAGLAGAGHKPVVQNFLRNSLDYKRNDPNGPPGSTNCHEEHGGKRGVNSRVFSALTGMALTQGGTRKWGAFTEAALSGTNAGCTGVVFQPSRIALDSYVVSVFATHDAGGGGPATIDTVDTTAKLLTDHASLPSTKSGTFQVFRKIRAHYVRKSAAVTSAVLATIQAEYRRAGVIFDFGSAGDRNNDEQLLAANYDTWFTAAKTTPDQKGKMSIEGFRNYFEPADQFQAGTGADTVFAAIAEGWADVTRRIKVDAIREYCNKARRINGPRRAYNTWLGGHGHNVANDHQYLLPYYNGLSQAKKNKVDVIYQRRMNAANLTDRASYQSGLEGAGIQVTRLIAEKLLLQLNQHGMVILHVERPMAYREAGIIQQPASHAGGLSPSTSAKWQGRGSVHLVFIPEVPTTTPDTKYHVPVTGVITHEAGHNLFLCHAPAAPPITDPAGTQRSIHDAADLLCLMNYDQNSDHMCGYCNLKLRGWGTIKKDGKPDAPGPTEDGLVGLSNISANNRKP